VLCNLGFEGTERVCDADGCTDGCHIDSDCTGEATCDSDGMALGTCGGMQGENIDICPGVTVNLSASMTSVQLMGDTSLASPPSEAEGEDMMNPTRFCTSVTPTEEDVYHLLVEDAGNLIINVEAAPTYDPIIYVRFGSCDTGVQLNCADDNASGSGEIMEVSTLSNDELWVFVDGYNGSTGSYTIDFDLTPN
jgi:hypothetical protein